MPAGVSDSLHAVGIFQPCNVRTGRILKREGIEKPDVEITQAYKVDLDGDGKDEVVIVANRYAQGLNIMTNKGHPEPETRVGPKL